MGTVWRARDTVLHREVALKAVRPDAAASDAIRERVLREARALARLSHPHVVTVHHIVDADPHPWIVMELVPGSSLQERLADGPLPPTEAARLGRQILSALRAAHAMRHPAPRRQTRQRPPPPRRNRRPHRLRHRGPGGVDLADGHR